jgi:hypothetical protein
MGQSITSKLNSITRIKENENNLLLWKQYNVDFVLQVPKKKNPEAAPRCTAAKNS